MQNETAFLVDGIHAIAIHNGVVRLQFMRLAMNGTPSPSVELHVPVTSMRSVVEALKKVSPG
jgi:signal transduction histidine kinase